MPDIVLTIAGKRYDGWTSATVRRGIEQITGAFSLAISEHWPGQAEPWPIACGDACTLTVDGAPVISGYVEDVAPRIDARRHELTISGRDATADLVDCSAANTPGRWENRTLIQIAADLCKPFGIGAEARTDMGAPFRTFALQPGETAFEAIERGCRFRGVLPISDGAGGLLLTGPGTDRVPVRLVQGENILAAGGLLSWRERFSQYIAKGSDAGFDDSTPEQNASPGASATDPNVGRYRPLIIIAEGPSNSGALQRRAQWEASMRRGRSARAVVTVQGWTHPDGVWQPNQLVHIDAPWLRIDADMLIAAVRLVRDKSGSRADLELAAPSAFQPVEIAEEADLWSD